MSLINLDLDVILECVKSIKDNAEKLFDGTAKQTIQIEVEKIKKLVELGTGRKTMPIEDVKCPDCGSKMVSRSGQFGVFWGCSTYPKCKGTRDSMGRSKADRAKEKEESSDDSRSNFERQNDNDKFRFRKQ